MNEGRQFLEYPFRGPKVQSDVITKLEDYIKSPSGVLVTDAETFYGVQARNIVIITSGTVVQRNYIMRSNSFVVCIELINTTSEYYNTISKEKDIFLDKTFLFEDFNKLVMLDDIQDDSQDDTQDCMLIREHAH